MSPNPRRIMVEIRRLPKGGWRVWKFYPKAKGTACSGWHHNDGTDLRELIPFALSGLERELIRRAEARLPKAAP